ncbi:MAG: hypothetical protein V7K96_05080 [Nostoc sp.]
MITDGKNVATMRFSYQFEKRMSQMGEDTAMFVENEHCCVAKIIQIGMSFSCKAEALLEAISIEGIFL